ncbi:STAS domain-containing protein [Kutzneria sp. NPDC052558]|uniref:STAS domain-containing protein n=1 Tax=Kutzneria sp. NPDC052558 TaxID=3364121 RepID=UPI0037C8B444
MSETSSRADAPVLWVDTEFAGAAVVVHVRGEIDMVSKDRLDERLRAAEAVAVPPAPVVLDLTGVRFLASMGLALLVTHHELCADRGTPLRVVATGHQVLRPIQITGLDQLLAITRSVAEAVGS